MRFDLSTHFIQNADHLFFDEKTYSDLLKDVLIFRSLYLKSVDQMIGLQFQSPYLCFAALLAALSSGKTGVMISALESNEGLQRLQSQVPFTKIYGDTDYIQFKTENSELSIERDQPAVIVFSSGSSGLPKGIVLSFDNLYYSALGFIEFVQQKKEDVSFMNLPHHHVGGLMTLWRAFFSGSSLVSQVEKDFTIISVVPLQLARTIKNDVQLARLKKCRIILVGGAKLTETLQSEAEKAGLKLFETYGMSETCSLVCLNGEVLPYRNVMIDQNNFFMVKGKTLAKGFYKKGTFEKMPVDENGWFKTNDAGSVQKNHFVFSHRTDLIFISGGENINPLLIEDILRTHPDIKDAYVLPVEDEQWGQMGICLFESSQSETEPDEKELRSFLKDKIHPYHIPKKFFRTQLSFPGQLKPKRSDLIKKAAELYLKNLFSFSTNEIVNAPFIVFLHGFTGSKDDFSLMVDKLSDEMPSRYSFLTIDLPGHGKTLANNFFSTTDLLSKLSRFIALFSNSPVLYGYSMGGRVALQLALHYLSPSKLILESAGPGLQTKEEADERQKADSELFNSFISTEDFIRHWYKQNLFQQYRLSENFELDIRNKFAHDLNEWKQSQKFLSQGVFPLKQKNTEKLKDMSFPIYYIYGSEDLKYKAYAPLFKQSFEIQGASHNPHKTHLLELTEIVKEILK